MVLAAARANADRLLRQALADHVDTDPDQVLVTRACGECGSSAHGRPVAHLSTSGPAPWISLSRSGGLVVVAVSDTGPVGIDVERVDQARLADVSPVLLHPEERATTPTEVAVTWVRKESLLKATGDGLQVDLRAVRLTAPEVPPALLEWHAPQRPLHVHMRDLVVAGHVAALTVLSPGTPQVTVRVTPQGAEAAPGR